MGREIISWKSLLRELAVSMRVCRIIVVIMMNVTWKLTLNVPTFMFMSTACRSKFGTPKNIFFLIELEMGLHFFLIGQKRANQNDEFTRHARMHTTWLACHVKARPIKKNPNVLNWQTSGHLFLKWFPVFEFTQRLHIYEGHTYLGSSFRWSLFFCCLLLVYFLKRGKENWCTADFFSRSSRGRIRKQCNVYNT